MAHVQVLPLPAFLQAWRVENVCMESWGSMASITSAKHTAHTLDRFCKGVAIFPGSEREGQGRASHLRAVSVETAVAI